MNKSIKKNYKSDRQRPISVCRCYIILFALLILQVPQLFAQENGQQSKYPIPGFVPVFKESYQGLYWSPLDSNIVIYGAILPLKSLLIKSVVKMDSSGTNFIFRRMYRGQDIQAPTIMSLSNYYLLAKDHSLFNFWSERLDEVIKREREAGRGGAIKIVGGTIAGQDLALRVTGNINIKGGIRQESRSTVALNFAENQNTSFKLDQKQQFNIEGTIGDKISLFVDQDSERDFEFENALKIRYVGDEDDIIKRIDAGNIDLSLPGTQFAVSGGRNQGLFGLKSLMKIGGLEITSVLSVERGKKQKLTLDGGATSQVRQINDYDFMRNTYFFLDDFYKDRLYPTIQTLFRAKPSNKRIQNIEVYLTAGGTETGSFEAIAVPDPNSPGQILNLTASRGIKQRFKRLVKNIDYEVSENHGFIRMNTHMSEEDVLAVSYIDLGGDVFGGQLESLGEGQDSLVILKLIKGKNPFPTDPTWNLEFKNVYYLGATSINKEGFELKIVDDRSSGEPQERDSKGINFLQLFGLDSLDVNGKSQPDQIFDIDSEAIINLQRGELWFPALRPFYTPNALDSRFYSQAIYDTTSQPVRQAASKFKIIVSYKNRSSTISLGLNFIEGSEEVILDGVVLVRGSDYTIDTFTGQLTILKEGATDPGANLEIKYENNQLFQLDKKSFLGTRAEYRFGENSFFGGTFLYYSKSTIDQRVRVGDEPIRNMLLDFNGKYSAKPNFISRGVNSLPIIKTDQPSLFSMEGEIAKIMPNPNTLNSSSTGDNQGVAYLDDFEASKRITSLTITRKHWYKASPPDFKTDNERAFTYWYNPFNRVLTTEIWEDRDVNKGQAGNFFTDVLNIEVDTRNNQRDVPDNTIDQEQRWGGVMRALPASFFDQSQTKFIEIWINGREGQVNLDIGHISEDANNDGVYNTEDIPVAGTIGNNIVDEGEDTGLDGLADENEEGYDPVTNPDPNADNWEFDSNARNLDYRRINGTEGNANDEGGRIPDSEDLNRNTFLDTRNDYFEYSFWLDGRDDHLIAGGRDNKNGWRLYRLPINEYNYKSGPNVNFQDIQYVRIWVTGLTGEKFIRIATIEMVANEWQELGVKLESSSEFDRDDSSFSITVVNTEDNDDIYDGKRENGDPSLQPPPGVEGVEDRITRVRAKEQSLVLKFKGLPPGATGAARKVFFSEQDVIRYGKIKMFVHGDKHFGKASSSIEFFMRLGRNDDSYYEVSQPVYPGWDERNHIDINLDSLTQLKLREGEFFNIGQGKKIRIVNSPSLTRLKQIVIGIRNHNVVPVSGEIWIDELRVSEIDREGGIAARGSATLKIADLGSMNFSITKQDADFHQIQDKIGKAGRSVESYSYRFNNTFRSNKLLPARWGLSIPITFNLSRSVKTPKYLPGTDIRVQGAAPDSIKNLNNQKKFGISFKKNSKSRSRFIKYTIDRSSTNLTILNQNGSSNQIASKFSTAYNGGFKYNLPIKRKSKITPFFWVRPVPWLGRKIGDEKFNFYPNSVDWNINATEQKSKNIPRRGVSTESYKFNMVRSFKTGFPVFRSITLDYGRGWTNDLSDLRQKKSDIFSGDFGTLTNANENFSTKWNPKIFNWLSTSFSYSSSYRFQHVRQRSSNDVGSQNQINSNLNFDLKKFMSIFANEESKSKKEKSKKQSNRRSTRGRREKSSGKQIEKDEATKKKKDNPTIGELLTSLSKKLQPVNITYSRAKSLSNPALIGEPGYAYKFGFTEDPKVKRDSLLVAENKKGLTTNFSARSGLNISRNLTINFTYSQNERKNQTSSSSLNITKTRDFFPIGVTGRDGFPFPSWNLRYSGLEKLPILRKFTKRVSLEHGFGGKENEKELETIRFIQETKMDSVSKEITGVDYSKSWQPLVGMTFNFNNSISATFRFNKSSSISNFFGGIREGTQFQKTSNISVTANYSRQGGINIPVFFLRDFKLVNQVTFSLTYDNGSSETLTRTGSTEVEPVVINFSKRWSLHPQMSYSFSSKLNGGIFFEIGKTETIHGSTSFRDFGLTVNIAIRG